jgi:hypothetical protein
MSGVEALEQTITTEAPQITDTAPISLDTELDAIYDRAFVTNGADRGDGGKFTSPNADTNTEAATTQEPEQASLEGETAGEGQVDGSTPVDVPLPANRLLNSLDPEWATLPPSVQQKLTERSNELHTRLSDMGKQVSTYKPLQEAATEFAEYFNGNVRAADGQPINPADGIRYLANIQRAMDTKPLETLLSIADTYNLREELAKAFGGQVQSVPQDQRILLDRIAGLEQRLSSVQSPAAIEQVLEERELQSEVSRFAASKPLYAQVEADLPFFITKAKTQLGEHVGRTAILDKAYELAVQADPALRAQTQAAPAATNGNAAKAEAARRAAGVNVTSTSSGKTKPPSLDDELGSIWDKARKA